MHYACSQTPGSPDMSHRFCPADSTVNNRYLETSRDPDIECLFAASARARSPVDLYASMAVPTVPQIPTRP